MSEGEKKLQDLLYDPLVRDIVKRVLDITERQHMQFINSVKQDLHQMQSHIRHLERHIEDITRGRRNPHQHDPYRQQPTGPPEMSPEEKYRQKIMVDPVVQPKKESLWSDIFGTKSNRIKG